MQDNISLRDLGVGVTPQIWLTKQIWQRVNENEMVMVNSSIESSTIYNKAYINEHASMDHIFARARTYWHLKSIKSTDSTKLTYFIQLNLGGKIPQQIVIRGAVGFMLDLSIMRRHFSRDYEIDLHSRASILHMMSVVNKGEIRQTETEKNDIRQAMDKFKKFDNSEGGTVKLATSDDFITAVGRLAEGNLWFKLSTTLRCSGEEALSFLLDVTSRSLLSKRDVVDDDGGENNKKILKEEGHSRTVKVVEEMTGIGGVRFNNNIVRDMVWEKRERNTKRGNHNWNDEEYDFFLLGSPSTEKEEAKMSSTSASASLSTQTTKFGRRLSSGKALVRKKDKSIVAIKITEVEQEESIIEMLVETPKRKRVELIVSEKEKRATERLLLTLYDYQTLSTMQRCFQRW